MGWSEEELNTKKGMSLSSKILLALIACLILMIIIILMILTNGKGTTYKITLDGATVNTISEENIFTTVDNVLYVNIEEFAKLVGYEYHKGEYKSTKIEEDKCYVEGPIETASFYINHNEVYKLLVNESNSTYNKFTIKNNIVTINNKNYAPIEAIGIAFNTFISQTENSFDIYTLDYLVTLYDATVQQWGYTSIAEQSFESKKSILYGYLIVNKEGGLYKIIDTGNTTEIVLDRYTSIEFLEYSKEFFVTNTSNQMGVINLDGTSKIEPLYESISLLDKEAGLYLIKQNSKYGVVKSRNVTVIFPEYDAIGVNSNITNTSSNNSLLLDTLIPVYKDNKCGAYDKQGNLILNLEFDSFGYASNSIEINGIKESVEPVLTIERCKGIVVKKGDKYGLISVDGKELVPVAVEGIYAIRGEEEDEKYFMLYNGEEINLIQRLISAGLLEEKAEEETGNPSIKNEIVVE